MDEQRQLILDQFTRQAIPFSEMHARDDAEIHRLLMDTAGIGPEDDVLDVACGPGLVACEVARVARHVTGVDLTRAMIELAEGDMPPRILLRVSIHSSAGFAAFEFAYGRICTSSNFGWPDRPDVSWRCSR